jgi:UDP-N-acetyl-D-mannosaminuronic acid dehydrogenase
MPDHVVSLTVTALKTMGKGVKNSKISILGTAYKADVDDSRFSPSEPVIRKLKELGANLVVYDPHCPDAFGATKAASLYECIKDADCLLVMVDHTEFKALNLAEIKQLMSDNPVIVDGKRIINPQETELNGFKYCGIGYGRLES